MVHLPPSGEWFRPPRRSNAAPTDELKTEEGVAAGKAGVCGLGRVSSLGKAKGAAGAAKDWGAGEWSCAGWEASLRGLRCGDAGSRLHSCLGISEPLRFCLWSSESPKDTLLALRGTLDASEVPWGPPWWKGGASGQPLALVHLCRVVTEPRGSCCRRSSLWDWGEEGAGPSRSQERTG